jgi:hypothetical protein
MSAFGVLNFVKAWGHNVLTWFTYAELATCWRAEKLLQTSRPELRAVLPRSERVAAWNSGLSERRKRATWSPGLWRISDFERHKGIYRLYLQGKSGSSPGVIFKYRLKLLISHNPNITVFSELRENGGGQTPSNGKRQFLFETNLQTRGWVPYAGDKLVSRPMTSPNISCGGRKTWANIRMGFEPADPVCDNSTGIG